MNVENNDSGLSVNYWHMNYKIGVFYSVLYEMYLRVGVIVLMNSE